MQDVYREAFKGTSLFAGVQIFQILISLLRGKFVALFLGAEGMGISGLYTSSLSMLVTVAGLGCSLSAVRYISGLEKDGASFWRNIRAIKGIFITVSFFGLLLTVALAFPLSAGSFRNSSYITRYMVLSLYVFFSLYSQGLSSIMQGMQELRTIALGNIIPSAVSVAISLPLYFFMHEKAIVPTLILLPLLNSVYFEAAVRGKLRLHKENTNTFCFGESFALFKDFVSLGIVTVFATLLGNVSLYLLNSVISRYGSFSDIGLYQAGNSITNQCIGLIFSAMSMEYFPRLSAIITDKDKMNETVNKQGEIVVLLAFPLLSVLMLSASVLIRVLLSDEFQPVKNFIRIISLGMLFKVASFPIGYISFAAGDKMSYFFLEGIYGNVMTLVLGYVGYRTGGVKGLAYSFLVNYMLYLAVISLFVRAKYLFRISASYFRLVVCSVCLLSGLFFVLRLDSPWGCLAAVAMSILYAAFSLCLLEKRTSVLRSVRNRFLKKGRDGTV